MNKPKPATLLRTKRDPSDLWPLTVNMDDSNLSTPLVDVPEGTICEVVDNPAQKYPGTFTVWFPQYEKYFTNGLMDWFTEV